jgi:1,4-alpha-glucan branching enzyme
MTPSTPFLSEFDRHLMSEGRHYRIYEKLGAHPVTVDGVAYVHFAVWAPNARAVSVIGDFNAWDASRHPLQCEDASGIWQGLVPSVPVDSVYKYAIQSALSDYRVEKADPVGFASELRPQTASKVCDLSGYVWGDAQWMAQRATRQRVDAPLNIYEVHLGSWRRREDKSWLTYREMAPMLAQYVKKMGYTHVELLPVGEHPFDGSWGYQVVGYFSPTSRFGSPQDFMFLIDTLHQAGIGVILDWVPAHFPRDEHGLGYFDGSHLYEHADPRQGLHQHWGTFIFNYGRREVSNFLISNALFWLEHYHIDGLRVDAVASMLYLDYGRNEGEWIPNRFGGRENLEAIEFLRRFNEQVALEYPDVLTIAEESTAWPLVSSPTALGGLGFSFKWNMGWMHDMLEYMVLDPIYRRYHHNLLTFSMMYTYSENYMLAFSHDEVVHLKKSMLSKMPGDDWQKFANLRVLAGFMFGHPGKKLNFMGAEFGQWHEWNHDFSLDWHLLEFERHQQLQAWWRDLNHFYRDEPTLWVGDQHPWGFKWVDCHDQDNSVVAFLRYDELATRATLFVCNFTPEPRHGYRLGAPWAGTWTEALNSDALAYGGSGIGNLGCQTALNEWCHGLPHSLILNIPPLATLVLTSVNPTLPGRTSDEKPGHDV